ncbi:MAG: ATP-binding cassette domain-containing protein, partial [Candidatus Micrarchaeota archaeon]|nr:ATP-binding cassette domain-containing protein [Candidatus Micrarchaeota archaeon]
MHPSILKVIEQRKAIKEKLSNIKHKIGVYSAKGGVGKTTVFKSILGLLPLQSGKITVDGDDISKWSASRMADTMAYVSQVHRPP